MSDPWVLGTQIWLNNTYGHLPQVGEIDETGKTGWATMYALTRALQHELGLTTLSDNFGPATEAAVSAISPINSTTSNKNIIRIIQGAMYCKGYNGGDGDLDGAYSATTIAGVQELRTDIGISPSNGFMTAKVLKALLTMDAYVLLDGGSPQIRTIQRTLNGRYLNRADFYILPADGFYSRGVQNALMYAIQYEIGMADGVANGNFGPGTQNGLRTLGDLGLGDTDTANGNYLVHLFQAALNFNGYPTDFTGVYDSGTDQTVRSFQAFCALPVNGSADFQTWASLLVSTGDVNRPGTAADTIRTITPARAATLVANGYQAVGRYLTNSPVADPLDKNIKPGELATLFGAGLTVVPIFQEGGDYLEYFTFEKGKYAGQRAFEAASDYGFKRGTVIYFAVDFDALEDEVRSNVVPYFEGIRLSMANNGYFYRVGVYGARNTCSIVSGEGLASLSYVSDMSTGYSGNLGFRLPTNWAFDQILEYEIGSGDGWVNIDKNIKSGRDSGASSVEMPSPLLDVRFPDGWTSLQDFAFAVKDEIHAEKNVLQIVGALHSPLAAASKVIEHDALITSLSRAYGMRKAFLQTVLGWEYGVINAFDEARDAEVLATYVHYYGLGPAPAVQHWDSSTGVCQVFAALTAIPAINWAGNQGLHALRNFDVNNKDDVWEIWNGLRSNEEFNIRIAAMVLLHKAALQQVPLGNLLTPTQDEVFKVLAKYNGDDDYGLMHRPLWNVFESYNSTLR